MTDPLLYLNIDVLHRGYVTLSQQHITAKPLRCSYEIGLEGAAKRTTELHHQDDITREYNTCPRGLLGILLSMDTDSSGAPSFY